MSRSGWSQFQLAEVRQAFGSDMGDLARYDSQMTQGRAGFDDAIQVFIVDLGLRLFEFAALMAHGRPDGIDF